MSGSVQLPLSPVLQERKDTASNTTNKKQRTIYHHRNQHCKNNKNDPLIGDNDSKMGKKRQKVHLPNRFLLGGNITDPLNLNGLMNDSNSNTIETVKLSPTPLQKPIHRTDVVNLILRPNIKDPLNLEGTYDMDNGNLMTNKRHRKHRRSFSKIDDTIESNDLNLNDDLLNDSISPQKYDNSNKRKRAQSLSLNTTSSTHQNKILCTVSNENISIKTQNTISSMNNTTKIIQTKRMLSESGLITHSITDSKDLSKINESSSTDTSLKSPINSSLINSAPNSTTKKRNSQSGTNTSVKEKKFCKNGFKFRYGNYNRYYGYRVGVDDYDHRLGHLKAEWFKDKNVLDIGCNCGNVTLYIAKTFEPKKIMGIDIDPQLIFAARKNIRCYIDKIENEKNKYPISCQINYGALMSQSNSNVLFPKNVYFTQGDYVPDSEEKLGLIKHEYDFILALSITKWIHLNTGDDGLKRFFKKIFLNLNIGGSLLLEPQSWISYKKKAKLTKETWENYQKIKFRPNDFTKYLLSKEVGFSTCKTIAMPHNKSKGFRRPILLFTKLDAKINQQN